MSGSTRLIWMSDSPTVATGLGTVGRQVLSRLAAWPSGKPGLGWEDDGI